MKKLYIVLSVLVVIIVAAVAYLLYFRTPQGSAPSPSGGSTTGSLPIAQNGTGGTGTNGGAGSGSLPGTGNTTGAASNFGIVADVPTLNYFVDAKNRTVLVQPDGEITAVVGGATSSLNTATTENIVSTGFSFDGKKLFINFGDRNNPQTSIFDVSSTVWTPLGLGMISPVWSPNDLRLAFLKANTDGSFALETLDLSKKSSKPVTLLTLHEQDLSLAWPNRTQIILMSKPSAYETSAPLIYNLAKGTLTQPIAATTGLETIWSGTTNTAALAFAAGAATRGGGLTLWNQGLGSSVGLTLTTLPSKCLFNLESQTASTGTAATPVLALYCGVPQDQNTFSNATLPDAYYEGALFTVDSLYRIRTDTGEVQIILTPQQAMDMTDLKIFGKILFFVNRYNNRLYAVSLGA